MRGGVSGEAALTTHASHRASARNRGGNSSVQELATVVDAARQSGSIRSAVIVVNDRAPGAHRCQWKQLFTQVLGSAVTITEVHVDHFEGATAAARGAAAWHSDLVVVVGGDGTINACVNGIGDACTQLAIVPAGTANDLSRLACQVMNPARSKADDWRQRDIDAITINAGPRFYSAGGIGWVAEVADTANRWRTGPTVKRKLFSLVGPLIYTLACLRVVLMQRDLGAKFKITYEDASDGREKSLDFDGYGMLVANCDRVGRSFHLAPVSEIDDGVFELIVFPRTSRKRLLKATLLAQSNKLFDLPEVFWLQVRSARVELSRSQSFFGDGEVLTEGAVFELALADNPVHIVGPLGPEPLGPEASGAGGAPGAANKPAAIREAA